MVNSFWETTYVNLSISTLKIRSPLCYRSNKALFMSVVVHSWMLALSWALSYYQNEIPWKYQILGTPLFEDSDTMFERHKCLFRISSFLPCQLLFYSIKIISHCILINTNDKFSHHISKIVVFPILIFCYSLELFCFQILLT